MKCKNLISKTVICICLVLVFTSCSNHVEVEEYTTIDSYCTDTWYVGTCVWVVDGMGFAKSLELWEQEVVKYEKIDSIRSLQRIKVDKCVKRLEECLEQSR